MHKSKIVLVLVLVLVFGLQMLADNVITITYGSYQLLEESRNWWLRQNFEKFEQLHPDIKVEELAIPYSEYDSALATMFEAGAGPDCFSITGMSVIPWLANGYLAPLDDLIDFSKYEDEFVPQQALAVRDGKRYAVLYEAIPYALNINKRLLDEAGASVPRTPDELIAVSNTIYDRTGAFGLIYGTNCANRTYLMQTFDPIYLGFGARIVRDGKFTVNEPQFIKAVEFLKRIFDSRGTPLGMPYGQQRNAFLAGQAAMTIDGCYWPGWVKGKAPEIYENLLVVPAPFPCRYGPLETSWIGVNANSDRAHQEAAAALLEFLYLEPEQANDWALISGMPGGLKHTVEAVLDEYPWFEAYAEVAPYGVPAPLPGYEAYTREIRDIVADYVCSACLGQRTPQEAMDELQRKLTETFGAQ